MDMLTDRASCLTAFLAGTPWSGADRRTVAGDASNRRYDRLTKVDGSTAILMDAPPEKDEDVRPFIRIAEYLAAIGLSAPRILEEHAEHGFLIIEDLGDDLFAALMARDPAMEQPLYEAAIDALVMLHRAEPLALPRHDVMWMQDANKVIFDWYAPDLQNGPQAEFDALFNPLSKSLDSAENVVILRDYHAQNLLWLPERAGAARVGQLDFQDALLGHRAYDIVSILQDARRDVSQAIETKMIGRYLEITGSEREEFLRAYALLGAQRNLCIMGIFTRLCARDGKPHYVDLIPRVWAYVQRDLKHPSLRELAKWVYANLPQPDPDYLAQLKAKCPNSPH